MALHIREFREADRATLIALWETCGLTRPWNDPDADIDRIQVSRDATILFGTVDDAVVASVMVGHDGHRGWIYYLAVTLDRQARGHGREMMAEAELWLTARGAPKVQLMVRQENEDAADFYSALGYERQDVTVLGKWLTPSTEADGGFEMPRVHDPSGRQASGKHAARPRPASPRSARRPGRDGA
ncbi:MAG: GNAT family acetyltransferase [Alphaproteobacteria bacterium]|nr:GNAT family acetyltransferase [Alphaproteobacteria bacterium]MBU2082781.1 GNAT family acetyltransferase [Alphaproteobacteria bacterium]MBU2143801.1 GNAT family acetyltransferase [Alphaproteobacteria bacterium]